MSILDDNLEIDVLANLANKYMKHKSTVMVYVPDYIQKYIYGGIIGDIDDDMVMTSNIKFDGNIIYHYHYWISINNSKYAKSSYSAKRGQYHCEYSGGTPVTPDYIIKWMDVWDHVYVHGV